jgi:hypothetical protein
MTRRAGIAAAIALVGAALVVAPSVRAQAPPQLPPPPPPPSSTTPPRTDRERESPPPRREPPPARNVEPRETRPSRPSPSPPPYYERERDEGAPGAHTGFQIAARTGYAVPLGSVSENAKMSDTFSGQVPILLEAGAKLTPNVFLGGYTSLSFGGAAGAFKSNYCSAPGAACTATSFRIGAEIQYHFQPWERLNPWVGFGAGFEWTSVGNNFTGRSNGVTYSGFELAHLMAGLDVRFSRLLAIGPFLDFSLGTYGKQHVVAFNIGQDSDISHTATHEWLTLGLRFTFLP